MGYSFSTASAAEKSVMAHFGKIFAFGDDCAG